jgi:glycosyltransferase involved in cell wall biosynthesis
LSSSDKIKILFLIPSCKVGGVPVIVLNLIKGLNEEQFHIELAAPNDGAFFEKFRENIEVYDVKIRGFYPNTIFYLRKILKKRHFDVLHANGRGAGLYARLASPGNDTKVVYSYHGFYYNHYCPLTKITYLIMEKLLLRWTDKVVCVSEGEKKQAIKARVLNEDKAVVIPNGIDIEKYNTQRKEKRGYVIGTLSKICIQKGLEYLIPAIVNLKKKYPSLLCLIAGGTQKEEVKREAKLKSMVKTLGMEKTIIFLGEIEDTRSFFNKIDLYVSSSLWEGLPTAILEAFAARVPVVATDVTGNNEVVIPDKTGILTKPKDSDSLAQAIDFAFKHRNRLRRLTDNAFDFVCRGYSMKSMTNNYETLYRNLLQS